MVSEIMVSAVRQGFFDFMIILWRGLGMWIRASGILAGLKEDEGILEAAMWPYENLEDLDKVYEIVLLTIF